MDDHGSVETRWLACTPEPPSDLPAGELAFFDVVRSSPCTPGDVEWHWHFPVVRLTDVLVPGRRYDASLFALEGSPASFDAVDWKNQPAIYQFTFRTSRWPTFAAHLAAYAAPGGLDQIAPGAIPFAALAAAIGPSARVNDDAILATVMGDLMGLPAHGPAAEPELVRIWQSSAAGEQLVALLLDGPEPLPRPGDGGLELRTAADASIPIVLVQSVSSARTLILCRNGASALSGMPPGALRLVATDRWIAADGSPQMDSAILDIDVPSRPAFLEPEGPP